MNSKIFTLLAVILFIGSCKRDERVMENDLNNEVVRILTYDWNPTNQPAEVLVRYDYAHYAPPIIRLLNSGATELQIADKLFWLETKNMKLIGDHARCDRVAKLLIQSQKRHDSR